MRLYGFGICLLLGAGTASAVPYALGDVFAGTGLGQVKVFTQTGTLIQTLNSTTGSTEMTGAAFDASGNYYVTGFEAHTLSKFDSNGNLVNAHFATGFNTDPESIVFDNANHMFVGQADGTHQILEFNATTGGAPIASFSPATQDRGTDWIDLAADERTMFYTSEGNQIKRFDIVSNTQLADFADNLPGPTAYALRIAPDGSVFVADTDRVLHLDKNGNIIQTYTPAGGTALFALNLDPDGTSFWTGNINAVGQLWKIDIATGSILHTFGTTPAFDVAGLAVFGEIRVSNPPSVPEPGSIILLGTIAALVGWKFRKRLA
jgi:DNA-binding beta-propeller fold protein YncE